MSGDGGDSRGGGGIPCQEGEGGDSQFSQKPYVRTCPFMCVVVVFVFSPPS